MIIGSAGVELVDVANTKAVETTSSIRKKPREVPPLATKEMVPVVDRR